VLFDKSRPNVKTKTLIR